VGGERNQDFRNSRPPKKQGRVFQSFIVKATLTPLGAPLFQRNGEQTRLVHRAYRQHEYRLVEIAKHVGVHPVTGSRRLKQAEQADMRLQDLTPIVELILRYSS